MHTIGTKYLLFRKCNCLYMSAFGLLSLEACYWVLPDDISHNTNFQS